MNNAQILSAHADAMNIPKRSKDQVSAALNKAAKTRSDKKMATMMLTHGRLEDDARQFVTDYLAATA